MGIVPENEEAPRVMALFKSSEGEPLGGQLEMGMDFDVEKLNILINTFLENEEPLPYSFFVNDEEVHTTLQKAVGDISLESILNITYVPQAIFRVRPVTRCSSTLRGHTEAVLCASFSPKGDSLATGSGDTTVRLWDLNTATPSATLRGHTSWVQVVSWSPDAKLLATGALDKTLRIWDMSKSHPTSYELKGHKNFITAISWEPFHKNVTCQRMVSSSKDGFVKIWNATLGGHEGKSVTCVKWGGEGLIYTGSQDRTVKVWTPEGKLVRVLQGHAHWVNTMALSTEYALRTGPYDPYGRRPASDEEAKVEAETRYNAALSGGHERLVTGSDDYTLFLWDPFTDKKPVARLTGHQALINHVAFSPNGRMVLSASFDKSIRLWDGLTGKFQATFRGHVGPVFQVAWSGDSRMFASASKDSTVKCWEIRTKKLKENLPGHEDQVFAVDWAPNGAYVVSGSLDKSVKLWKSS